MNLRGLQCQQVRPNPDSEFQDFKRSWAVDSLDNGAVSTWFSFAMHGSGRTQVDFNRVISFLYFLPIVKYFP